METKPNAFAQMFSSERLIGALILLLIVGFTLLYPEVYGEWQEIIVMLMAAMVAQFVGLHTYVKLSAGGIVLNEDKGRPFIEPLTKLWRSRKFMSTVVGLLLELLVIYLHLPEAYKMQLLGTILLLITLYNGALAVEDKRSNEFFRGEATQRAI